MTGKKEQYPNWRKIWSDEDDHYLSAHWGAIPDAEVSRVLGRSERAIEIRAKRIGCLRQHGNTPFGPHPRHKCPDCGERLNGAAFKSTDTAASILYMCPRAIGEQVRQYGLWILPRESQHSAIVFYVEWKGVLEVFREDNRVIKEGEYHEFKEAA